MTRYRFTILLGAFGAIGGIVYAELVGCESGCVMGSSPWIMDAYGTFFGAIVGSYIDDYRKKRLQKEKESSPDNLDIQE